MFTIQQKANQHGIVDYVPRSEVCPFGHPVYVCVLLLLLRCGPPQSPSLCAGGSINALGERKRDFF